MYKTNKTVYFQEIKNLVSSIQDKYKSKETLKLDLVLEGGACNGYYELGCLLFLKEMERKNYIQIERISGASIGSLLGFLYFTQDIEKFIYLYSNIKKHFKQHMNLNIYKRELKKVFSCMTDNNFDLIKQDKLYIAYNNIKTNERIVKSNFCTKEELYNTILKSCHIPFVTDNMFCEEGIFIDGAYPFIFENRENENYKNKRILYISINQLNELKNMLKFDLKNPYGKILTGILKCYELFYEETNNSMCSFVDKWNSNDCFKLRFKQMIFTFIIYIFHLCYSFKKYSVPFLQNSYYYQLLKPVIKKMYRDLILYLCF